MHFGCPAGPAHSFVLSTYVSSGVVLCLWRRVGGLETQEMRSVASLYNMTEIMLNTKQNNKHTKVS